MNTACHLCQKNWILYQKKCYLFYNKRSPWKTWNQSRTFCQEKSADLVVIDDLQEQVIITPTTQPLTSEKKEFLLLLQN